MTSSPSSHDVIELALATATSLPISKLDGTALVWLIVAGAPSSDKTATVLTLKNAPNIFHLDTMTEHSFVSGFIDPKSGEHAKDLLDELNGKCLVIKDMTSLFSQRDDKVKQILGDLQSIYDGQFIKFTGTRGRIAKEASFSTIGCITPMALSRHHRYMAAIGGRFLVYRVGACQ